MCHVPNHAVRTRRPGPAPDTPPTRPRRTGRIILFVGLGIAAFVGALVGLVLMFTQDMTKAGTDFMAAFTSQPAAWRMASPDLQQTITEEEFTRRLPIQAWQGASVSWNSRSRTNNEGTLAGTISQPDGRTTPVSLRLRKGAADTWQVLGITIGPRAAEKP